MTANKNITFRYHKREKRAQMSNVFLNGFKGSLVISNSDYIFEVENRNLVVFMASTIFVF